jgi:hypothetical protein
VEEEQRFTDLINDVPFVLIMQNVALTDECMQIDVHMLKDQIDIDVVVGFHDAFECDDVGV